MRLVKPVKDVTFGFDFHSQRYGKGSYCDHIPVLIVQMTSLSLDFKLFAIVGIQTWKPKSDSRQPETFPSAPIVKALRNINSARALETSQAQTNTKILKRGPSLFPRLSATCQKSTNDRYLFRKQAVIMVIFPTATRGLNCISTWRFRCS